MTSSTCSSTPNTISSTATAFTTSINLPIRHQHQHYRFHNSPINPRSLSSLRPQTLFHTPTLRRYRHPFSTRHTSASAGSATPSHSQKQQQQQQQQHSSPLPSHSQSVSSSSSSTTTSPPPSNDQNDHDSLDASETIQPVKLQPLTKSQSAQINASIARIALPALGTLALDPLVALADMACVGHLGATALGGVGIGNNVFNISFTCFNFLGLATTPAIARAYARNDVDEASRLIAQALWVALVSGLSAMLMLSIFTRPILMFFGANQAILPHAIAYLRARIIAAPFFLAAMVGNGTFRGFQDTKTPLFVGLFANTLNLILYPSLIFAFKLGTRGAGIAMATGQICAGLTLLILLIRTKKLRLTDMSQLPRPKQFLSLLQTGAVLSVRTLSIYSTISYATATAAKMGTVQVAAFEIGRQIFALFARLLDAISVAAQSLVALTLGQNDLVLARRTANRILRIGLSMGCGFVAMLLLVINNAPSVFTQSLAVKAMVTQTFPFMAAIQPINGLVFVFDGIYTAGRKFTTLSSAIFVAACVASSFLYFVRTSALPLHYVWLGLNIMMVIRASVLGLLYFTKWSPVPPLRTYRQQYEEKHNDTSSEDGINNNNSGTTIIDVDVTSTNSTTRTLDDSSNENNENNKNNDVENSGNGIMASTTK